MASVLLVLLVATLALSGGASRPEPEPEPQQLSHPSSSSSCKDLVFVGTLSCDHAEGAMLQVRDKCCNELGKCGKFICPAVKQVADSIPFLQGLCGDYDACTARKWWNSDDQTGEEDHTTSSKLECKLVDPEEKANECKAAVEAVKENHMRCFCDQLKRN